MKKTLIALAGLVLSVASAQSCTPTISQTEGPYYSTNAPKNSNLATKNTTGEKIVLSGKVLNSQCKPLANVTLDFWQADDSGEYDNSGYNFRGKVITNSKGEYQITTVLPGLYPGRTRHIHVKLNVSGKDVLTTQLYFPNVAQNQRDNIYHSSLLVKLSEKTGTKQAAFNFVIRN